MSLQRRKLGAEGERRAADYFESQGYRILERNLRIAGVEIDLVVAKPRLLVFVEVKTRSNQRHGMPEESVDAAKQARIVRGAMAWLHEKGKRHRHSRLRFDVIAWQTSRADYSNSIEHENETSKTHDTHTWKLRHWEAAFTADD